MIPILPLLFEVVALSFHVIGDDSLIGSLGTTVRVGGANGAVFRNRNHVLEASGVTIDGGGGGEDDVGDIMTCRGAQEADSPVDVCAVVL